MSRAARVCCQYGQRAAAESLAAEDLTERDAAEASEPTAAPERPGDVAGTERVSISSVPS